MCLQIDIGYIAHTVMQNGCTRLLVKLCRTQADIAVEDVILI